jgi:ferredoxin
MMDVLDIMKAQSLSNQYTIRIEPLGKEVTATEGETVLDALRRQFYGRDGQPFFPGCRRGGCAYCKAKIIAGEVRHHHIYSRAALADEERTNNYILTCQSWPLSDLTLQLLKGVRRR